MPHHTLYECSLRSDLRTSMGWRRRNAYFGYFFSFHLSYIAADSTYSLHGWVAPIVILMRCSQKLISLFSLKTILDKMRDAGCVRLHRLQLNEHVCSLFLFCVIAPCGFHTSTEGEPFLEHFTKRRIHFLWLFFWDSSRSSHLLSLNLQAFIVPRRTHDTVCTLRWLRLI